MITSFHMEVIFYNIGDIPLYKFSQPSFLRKLSCIKVYYFFNKMSRGNLHKIIALLECYVNTYIKIIFWRLYGNTNSINTSY
nr:MAG TPA: hypothetical protein [Caudoviricetes sp.]